MTTYIICDNSQCGKKFKSPIQVANLEAQQLEINGVKTKCPHCGTITLVEKRNMVNE